MMDKISFSIKPEFSSVEIVRREVRAALHKWRGLVKDSRIDDFCQIVSELVNNAVEHGRCASIEGELRAEDDKVLFTLITDGVVFDPTGRKTGMPDFDEKNDLPEGGYGLAIISQLADEFEYTCLKGKNVTVVAKKFEKYD